MTWCPLLWPIGSLLVHTRARRFARPSGLPRDATMSIVSSFTSSPRPALAPSGAPRRSRPRPATDRRPAAPASRSDVATRARSSPASTSDAAPSPPAPVSRRAFALAAAAAAAALAPPARADDDDDLDEDAAQAAIEASMRDVLKAQSGEQTYPRQTAFGAPGQPMQASFEVSSLWSVSPKTVVVGSGAKDASLATWTDVVDPVNGKVIQGVSMFVTPGYRTPNITDLGAPENVPVAKALGLDGDDSYRRADMLGSAKRVAPDGQTYYDWEMVASPPPKQCPSAVGCLYPDHIYLMSATVRDGNLYVLSVDAFPENWRQAGNNLRRVRGSFEVRPTPIGVEGETTVPAETETEPVATQ